jgi:hypothetical protein
MLTNLKVTVVKRRIRIRSWIRNRPVPVPKCHGSGTLAKTLKKMPPEILVVPEIEDVVGPVPPAHHLRLQPLLPVLPRHGTVYIVLYQWSVPCSAFGLYLSRHNECKHEPPLNAGISAAD